MVFEVAERSYGSNLNYLATTGWLEEPQGQSKRDQGVRCNKHGGGKRCLHKSKSDFVRTNGDGVNGGQMLGHNPRVPSGVVPSDKSALDKQPLKKANTFPYQMLHNGHHQLYFWRLRL